MTWQDLEIDPAESRVEWMGKKATGRHYGTIEVLEGSLTLDNGALRGGRVIIDMGSIRILDVTDPDTNAQIAGRLASQDFFAVEQFPKAGLEVSSVSDRVNRHQHVAAWLTIRRISNLVEFDIEITTSGRKYSASLTVDRTRFGLKFRSGSFFNDLGNSLVYNGFTLNVQLVTKPLL